MIPASIPTRTPATRFAQTVKRAWRPTRFTTTRRIPRGHCCRLWSSATPAGHCWGATSSPAGSFAVDGEGQQRVPSSPDKTTVARIHVEDPVCDGGTTVVERSARCYGSVDPFEFLPRVEIPDDRAFLARVGSEVTIHRPREQDAGDHGDSLRVCRDAPLRSPSADRFWRRGMPLQCPAFDLQSTHPSRRQVRLLRRTGDGNVDGTLISRNAPLDAPQRAARTDLYLPECLAASLWVESVEDAGLLPR